MTMNWRWFDRYIFVSLAAAHRNNISPSSDIEHKFVSQIDMSWENWCKNLFGSSARFESNAIRFFSLRFGTFLLIDMIWFNRTDLTTHLNDNKAMCDATKKNKINTIYWMQEWIWTTYSDTQLHTYTHCQCHAQCIQTIKEGQAMRQRASIAFL